MVYSWARGCADSGSCIVKDEANDRATFGQRDVRSAYITDVTGPAPANPANAGVEAYAYPPPSAEGQPFMHFGWHCSSALESTRRIRLLQSLHLAAVRDIEAEVQTFPMPRSVCCGPPEAPNC